MSESMVQVLSTMLELERVIEENGGEIPPGSDLEARWDSAVRALAVKVDDTAEYCFRLEGEADRLEEAAKQLAAKARARRNLRGRILSYVDDFAIREGEDEVRGAVWRIRRRLNPPAVNITSEEDVADTCPEAVSIERVVKIDKTKLKQVLQSEAGRGVRGAVITRSTRMEIAP